jgi:DNA polymerase-1
MKLLLVDGHNLLFQMFFGMPNRIMGKSGRYIEGVIGFVGALGRIIDMTGATHTAVLFDSEGHNPRCDLLAQYKQNRPDYSNVPDEENPFTILPDVYRALDVMGIAHAEIKECEVDDVIASYTLTYPEIQTVISSFDSDYFQLITDNVTVLRYRGMSSVLCDKEYLGARLGITPELYVSHKCLVGDASDNIKGVRGIGTKTATRIVNKYGRLEELLCDTSVIEEVKHREAIEEAKERLTCNLALIRLTAGKPLPFGIEDMRLPSERKRTMEIIDALGI